jgi:hypothetical protein
MDRGNSKHGRLLDEQLAKETEGLVRGGHDTRAEEWHSPEPPGEDQPEVDLAPGTALTGGVPPGLTPEDVAGRAELGAVLGKELWPADRDRIRRRADEQHAPDHILELIAQLPESTYANVAEVWLALTGAKEARRF